MVDPNRIPSKPTPISDEVKCVKIIGPLINGKPVQFGSAKVQHRFRAKELLKIIGDEDEVITSIHTTSKAEIRILEHAPAKKDGQLYIQILGSDLQVQIAEFLIKEAIKEGYTEPLIPTPLMPTPIFKLAINIELDQVEPFMGTNGINILKIESESKTWIEVDTLERKVKVYGQKEEDIFKAKLMINDQLGQVNKELKVRSNGAAKEVGSSEQLGKMDIDSGIEESSEQLGKMNIDSGIEESDDDSGTSTKKKIA
ncbi:unnamed protein product [Lactuca virosa]|uniref:K Homology domain-containing protein n=1 Tax=Lactuca virosa TaxID=75947 RepID=A0AAU9NFC5_9ASTR|nr:unnamed protein product [Lactuca virosa]